jgi:hypothetical protein
MSGDVANMESIATVAVTTLERVIAVENEVADATSDVSVQMSRGSEMFYGLVALHVDVIAAIQARNRRSKSCSMLRSQEVCCERPPFFMRLGIKMSHDATTVDLSVIRAVSAGK